MEKTEDNNDKGKSEKYLKPIIPMIHKKAVLNNDVESPDLAENILKRPIKI